MTTPDAPNRRAALAFLAAAALAPAIGCSSSPRTRRYAPSSSAPGPRWPDLPIDRYTPRNRSAVITRPEALSAPSGVKRRAEWATVAAIPRRMDRMQPVRRLTVHHDGMPPVQLRNASDVASRIDLIRRAHQRQGWGDIGYHYVVDPFGQVWEGRPLSWQGAHVAAQNQGNLGVMVLGNFQKQRPTAAQLDALDRFVAAQMNAHRIPVARVHTHQEFAPTACPGRSLQAHMTTARRPAGRLAMLTNQRSFG